MAIIKKFSPFQNLSSFSSFINDTNPNSQYFRISEFSEQFTGGKNGFLIEGSEFLKEGTEVKIEILDVSGNPVYFEPGDGVPEYYEGTSKLVSVHVYEDTPIGIGKITVLGELKTYLGTEGELLEIPEEWKGVYNVKWEKEFKINKNLSNENIVRFHKRPLVTITELVKPIFSKTIPTKTDTGYVHGISEIPPSGTDITTWRAGTNYKLKLTSGSWDRDVDENTISVTSPTFSGKIIEVINDTEALVNVPYSLNNIVSNFTSGSYSITYSDFNNEIIGESALTGSFAKIDITQLKTFVGDVARVKVFRKSRNQVGDFQFVQESKLESSELLRDITTQNDTELSYGRFDESNLSTYWVSSSNDHPLSIDSSVLSQAVKFDYNTVAGGVQQLITSESISISTDVEYTLNFKTILSGSLNDTNKSIRAFFSSSNFTQDFLTISGSAIYRTRQNISKNIISENTGDAKLVFEVQGDDWYISNASLKNAQETSFSPDEFTLIQDIPRKTASETFDFRFEFYDINNNYIPVDVTAVGVFDGGNDFPSSGKLLTFESDRNAFRFSSGSVQNPTGQQIQLKVSQNNLTGSVTFASSAFDVDGNYLNPSDYSQYPGKLTSVNSAGAIITINNFTGSRTDGLDTPFIGSVVYTASLENLEEFETVYRLEDGDNAPQLIVTSNANQFIYEPTTLSPKPSGQSITVRAQRKNLASLVTPIEVNSGSNKPQLTYVDTVGGIDTYTISATAFSQSFASNNFDEVTYSFTGSDVFGNSQTDEITLSKVINFDAVSLVLSNESTAFPAKSTGVVTGGFAASSGSVQMFIGGTQITHDDYDSDSAREKNTFDIKTITATNVTATDTSPNTANYSISDFDSTKDSGSLLLDIEYLAGDNSTSQSFQKIVSYTKAKKAVPIVLTKTSPSSQTINSSSVGFETVQDVEVIVQEGGTEYTYDSSLSGGGDSNARKFDIVSVHSGSDNGDGTLTPTAGTFTAYNGTIGSASLNYVDSEGTYVTGKTVRFDVSVSKTGIDGQDGFSTKLTNEAHVFTANSLGTITSNLSDGAFETRMFRGSTQFTYEDNGAPYSANTYRINATSSSIELSQSTVSNQRKFTPTSVSGESGSANITIIDNGTGIGFEQTYTFAKAKAGVPSVNVSVSPQAQTVASSSVGGYGTPSNVTVKVVEGSTTYTYDNGSPYDNQSFRITNADNGTNNNNGTVSPPAVSSDSGFSETITLTYVNSEGTEITGQTIDYNVGVAVQGQDGQVALSPTSLRVSDSLDSTPFDDSPGSTGTPTISNTHYGLWNSSATAITTNTGFDNIHYLGLGETLTSDNNFSTDMKVYCQRTLEVGDVVVLYQDDSNYGNYTVHTKTNADGSGDTVLRLTPISHAGTLTVQSLDYIGFGRELVGPGVVYRGEYDSGTTYYYSETRRDVVEYSGTYYLASNPSDSGTSNWGTPGSSTDWETFGAEFSSVATDILFAQDVYANRTINIGSDGVNPVIALNSDHANSNANPYISIGAASYEGAGIFLGYDSGTAKTSLVNSDGTRYLKWDGSNLDIKGSITITGGPAASSLSSLNSATQSLQSGVNAINATTGGLENPTSYNFGPNGGPGFDLIDVTPGSTEGLYLGASNLGYHDGSDWNAYLDSSGNFYLGGTSGALTWDGSTLNIAGSISITGGSAQSALNSINSTTQSLQDEVNSLDGAVSQLESVTSSLENPTSYSFNPNNLDSINTPTVTGLHLGDDKLGYYQTSSPAGWKSYMDSQGRFYLGGGGALSWNGTNLAIAGSITITGGPAASQLSSLNDATQSLDNSVGLLNTATESLQTDVNNAQGGVDAINATTGGLENPTSYDFGPNGSNGQFALDSVPATPNTAGLYLGAEYMGYHNGTDWKTFISSSGDAFFEGTVSGSSILGGNISIGGGNFAVNNEGRLTATDAVISGEISSSEATLGAWLVNEDAITANTGTIVLNATDEYIHLKDSSLVTKVNLNTESSLTTPAAGNSNNGSEDAATRSGGTTSNNVFYNPSVTREEITSFSATAGGNHEFTYQYTNGNQSYVSATGVGTYISGRVTLSVWTGDYGTTLVTSTTLESKFAQGDTYDQPPSVIGNTKIILSNGLVKLAKDITKEDELLTWDYKTKTFATAKPSTIKTRTVYKTYKVYVEDKEVEVSENHGFWLDNNHEIKVKKLKAGKDKIYIKDGNEVKLSLVKKVEKINKQEKVFTFRIPEYENYISNEILSHNPGFDETDTQYFTDNKSATVSWNATNGVDYYFTLEYSVSGQLITAMGASNPEILYQFNYDGNWSWSSLNSGTEINNAGLQVSNDGDRVFRAQTSTTAGDPWITMIGGMEVDYFVPRYSHQTAGTYSYGSTGNLDINYSKKSYPLTRAMWRIVLSASSDYDGTFSTLSVDDPHINIVGAVRYSNSSSSGGNTDRNQYFRVQLDEAMTDNEACPFVSSYGRAGDSPSWTNWDAEFTSDVGVKYGTSGYVYYQFMDNDTSSGRDAYIHYGVVFG